MPAGAVGNKLAIRVVSMGWSWAPFLAQTAAEDLIGSVPQLLSERAENSDVVQDFDDVHVRAVTSVSMAILQSQFAVDTSF